MKYDLTILVPAIRHHLWKRFVDSAKESCSLNYEILFIGPFPPLEDLGKNVRYIKSFCTVPVCMQMATLEARGKHIYHNCDDAVLLPNAIDNSYQELMTKTDKDIMNMRFREGVDFKGESLKLETWKCGWHQALRLPGINPDWGIAVQPMFNREYFIDLGGFDCRFEYSNHCHHDFAFRAQKNGSQVLQSPVECATLSHQPGTSGDHEPIHNAQLGHDEPIFIEMYSRNDRQIKIDFDNYLEFNQPWKRRFKKDYTSYEEMVK